MRGTASTPNIVLCLYLEGPRLSFAGKKLVWGMIFIAVFKNMHGEAVRKHCLTKAFMIFPWSSCISDVFHLIDIIKIL